MDGTTNLIHDFQKQRRISGDVQPGRNGMRRDLPAFSDEVFTAVKGEALS